MKEFEKDEILENEETTQEMTEDVSENEECEKTEDTDDLKEELEGIRDMLQEELDKAQAEEDGNSPVEESELIIQELEEIPEEATSEEEETDPAPLCQCCEENRVSGTYGEDYPYCDECREAMKKYPLRWSGIFMTVVMAAVLCASVYFGSSYLADVSTVADASAYYKSGYTMDTMQSYYTYFNGGQSGESISNRALKELIDCYIKTGYYSDAATLINTYFTETDLKMPWNKKYVEITEKSTSLTETYYAVSSVASAALNGQEFDYDEVMASLEALKESNPLQESTGSFESYDDIFIEYYKFVVMSINGESPETQLEQLKKIDEIGEGFEWAYLANYCAVAAITGDEALTKNLFERGVAINRQDMNIYTAMASYYRYLEEPDADAILEIAKQAEEAAYSSDVSYLPVYTIAYLLKGEGATALEYIETYMNSGSYTLQGCNLYALCGVYTGDTSIYEEMIDLLAYYGYNVSDLVTQYMNKEITLTEALQDKGGDF